MIYKLTEEWAIRPIAEMILSKPEVFKINEHKLIKYLLMGVKDENSVIIVDEKDKAIRGFIFASIEEFDGQDVCFLHCSVIEPPEGDEKLDPQRLNSGHEMLERLRRWCVDKNVVGKNKILISTSFDKQRFYARRYKFKPQSLILARDVLTDDQKKELKNGQFLLR